MMIIPKATLDEMNGLISKGKTIAYLANKYPAYNYWEIYCQVKDSSFLGKKRAVSNRLKKMVATTNKAEREELSREINSIVDDLYGYLKTNSKKLFQIGRVLSKDT